MKSKKRLQDVWYFLLIKFLLIQKELFNPKIVAQFRLNCIFYAFMHAHILMSWKFYMIWWNWNEMKWNESALLLCVQYSNLSLLSKFIHHLSKKFFICTGIFNLKQSGIFLKDYIAMSLSHSYSFVCLINSKFMRLIERLSLKRQEKLFTATISLSRCW